MKPCPKTVSGKHHWLKYKKVKVFEEKREHWWLVYSIIFSFKKVKRKYPKCKYCGMIDDRKIIKK